MLLLIRNSNLVVPGVTKYCFLSNSSKQLRTISNDNFHEQRAVIIKYPKAKSLLSLPGQLLLYVTKNTLNQNYTL